MSRSIWVFSSESGSKSVNIAHWAGIVFSGQLATDCQESRLFEEIFSIIYDFGGLILGDIGNSFFLLGKDSGDLEHGSCSFTVTGGYQWSAYVYESSILVEQMRGQ